MRIRLHLLSLPLLLAACSPSPSGSSDSHAAAPAHALASAVAQPVDAAVLTAYHWQLQSAVDSNEQRIDALFARTGKPLQLDFERGRLSVANACNRIVGSYTIEQGRLHAGTLASTRMVCVDPRLSALDAAITRRLTSSPEVVIDASGRMPLLHLHTPDDDTLVFAGEPTPETRYGGAGEKMFLEVAAHTVPCTYPWVPMAQCLSVRERHFDARGLQAGLPGPWRTLAQPIEGYTHQDGVRNVLRVTRYQVKNPVAGSAPVAYVLDTVIGSSVEKKR